jgi:hypothetical protein
MSKKNLIEQALSALDATAFHKLVDQYLNKKYNYLIHSIGTKEGEDKPTTGTPDTLIPIDGKYIFVEYTTQKRDIIKKFLDDLKKCFDETKTKIPKAKIEEIILACNSKLSIKDIETLQNRCSNEHIACELLTLSVLSNELINHYPSLAEEYLHVTIDRNQILDLDDFIQAYDSKFSIPIGTSFYFRAQEKEQILISLTTHQILSISGAPGVGKTRLAIECCKEYATLNHYKLYCISPHSVDILDDLKTYFSGEENYLIFIDDVNRISYVLQYIIELFPQKIASNQIKLVLTLRSYAKDKIADTFKKYTNFSTLDIYIPCFQNREIEIFMKSEFNIENNRYLEQIAKVSEGNPRLAAMMGKVINETDNIETIRDVSSIYEQYFSSIQEDIFQEENHTLLQVTAIIAFYWYIDKKDETQVSQITHIFGLSMEDFWSCISILHKYEIVDIYEDEVAKVSDQILSTYLFYEAVFKRKLLPIKLFLENFLETNHGRINDVIIPIFDKFNKELILQTLHPSVDKLWQDKFKSNDKEFLSALASHFYFLKPVEILMFVKNQIEELESDDMSTCTVDFEKDSVRYYEAYHSLNILKKFSGSEQYYSLAIDLVLLYFSKKPSQAKEFLAVLLEAFGLNDNAYEQDFIIQKTLIDKLLKNIETSEIFIPLFYEVAKDFIHTRAHNSYEVIGWSAFKTVQEGDLQNFRRTIWKSIFSMYESQETYIKTLLLDYLLDHHHYEPSNFASWDREIFEQFFWEKLNPEIYLDCKIVHDFIDFFEKNELKIDQKLSLKFEHKYLEVYRVFSLTRLELRREYQDMNFKELSDISAANIDHYIENLSLQDYKKLFEALAEIIKYTADRWQFHENFFHIFETLYKKDKALFEDVIRLYYDNLDNIGIYCYPTIKFYYEKNGKEKTIQFLTTLSIENIDDLWFNYFAYLKEDDITKEDISMLLNYYQTAKACRIAYSLDFLEKYQNYDNSLIISIVKMIKQRNLFTQDSTFLMSKMLDTSSKNIHYICDIFKTEVALLEWLYVQTDALNSHFDFDAKLLNGILDLDPLFLVKYIQHLFDSNDKLDKNDGKRLYSILWDRDNYHEIMSSLMNCIYENRKKFKHYHIQSFLIRFYLQKQTRIGQEANLVKRQIEFLKNYIKIKTFDEIEFIFEELICDLEESAKRELFKSFLEVNKSIDDFKKLILEPSHFIFSGSLAVRWLNRLAFYESLKEIIGSDIELLPHLHEIEKKCDIFKSYLKDAKKRDFIDGH